MTEPFAYWNGKLLPQSQVYIPLNDAGFVWGTTVTDLCRTFRHELFRLEDHLTRFRRSCKLAKVPQFVSDEELAASAIELVARNAKLLDAKQDLALVLLATPGEIGYYLGRSGGPGDATPTLIMHTFPLPFERYARFFRDGVHLVTPALRRRSANRKSPQIKHRSRLAWWLAEEEARQTDLKANALLLDQDGRITETAIANFLVVRNGQVLSPRRENILDGISLRTAEELCGELGIEFHERDLRLEDCQDAEEAMLTGTSFCVAPVRRINAQEIPWPGPIFGKLLAAWSGKVGVDIRGQILGDIIQK